jgi:hypothetical protein
MIIAVSAAGTAVAGEKAQNSTSNSTQNVNVVNTPTVTVGSMPPVSISGTPTVNANVTFPATQGVTLMNTTSNPGSVLDADKATRIPYQSAILSSQCFGLATCQFQFAPIPSGYRLVVENISADITLASGTTAPPSLQLQDTSHYTHRRLTGTLGQNDANYAYAGLNENIRAYFDPLDGPVVAYLTANFPVIGAFEFVTLTGYLENCAVAVCPAIAR